MATIPIKNALLNANPASLPVATVTGNSSPGTGHVLNLRLFPVRPASISHKDPSSAYDHVPLPGQPSLVAPKLHNVVVNSTTATAVISVADTQQPTIPEANSAYIPASSVTASSFQHSGLSSQQPVYMFSAMAASTPKTFHVITTQSTTITTTSTGTPIPTSTKPSVTSNISQQAVRAVLNQALINSGQPAQPFNRYI